MSRFAKNSLRTVVICQPQTIRVFGDVEPPLNDSAGRTEMALLPFHTFFGIDFSKSIKLPIAASVSHARSLQ